MGLACMGQAPSPALPHPGRHQRGTRRVYSSAVEHVKAGWYPAPNNPGLVRYWDGELWTDRMRPAAASRDTSLAPRASIEPRVLNDVEINEVLEIDEWVVAGFVGQNGLRTAVFVATDQRVIVAQRGFRRKLTIIAFADITHARVGRVKSTVHETGVLLTADRRDHHCFGADLRAMVDFVDYVRLRMTSGTASPQTPLQPPTSPPAGEPHLLVETPQAAFVAELERLHLLHRQGGLTDTEFTAAKAKLLAE